MNVFREFERLINYGLQHKLFSEEDKIYIRNSLIELFDIDEYIIVEVEDENLENPSDILNNLLDYAYKKGLIKLNTIEYRDLLDTKIMSLLIPRPSEVIKEFKKEYLKDASYATDYLYNLSRSCDYIRTSRISKNIMWKVKTEYGNLDITINLSKPEKDPKTISNLKNINTPSYPKCLLCKENIGYRGRVNHPARQNLRTIPITLNNESWNLQYSPYSYYNEHCIIFASEHNPMVINKSTFDRLLEFVDLFPNYFIGSNADLPIVGGSILTHDHYQGGKYEFAMAKADNLYDFSINGYEKVNVSIIKWPLSVVRIKSKDRYKLSELGDKILSHWKNYSDFSIDVYSHTNETPHNTITPIARKKGRYFELDLVLRNNKTSETYPDGIYHPHKELHNIKKENIGLIEVLGLAVLPPRLKNEIDIIKKCLIKKLDECVIKDDEKLKIHLQWFNNIKNKYNDLNENNIDQILQNEIGIVFKNVLQHCGVLKDSKSIESYIKDLQNYIK